MYDFTHDQLQAILQLQPEGSSHELYREGFVEAQRAIYRKLSGNFSTGAIEPKDVQPGAAATPADQPIAVGMRVRLKQNSRVHTITALEPGVVSVGLPDEGWVRRFSRSQFWDYFDVVDPSEGLVKSSLELADELTRISKIIDELTVGYGNAGRSKDDAWSSKLFAALSARRGELRRELVALG